jgi:hypothetical protein
MKERRLISSPIHTPIHELEEIEIIVPRVNINKNKI